MGPLLTPAEVLALVRESWDEATFTRELVALARSLGWLAMHPLPARSRRGWHTPTQGDTGYPDVTLTRRGRLVIAELKVGRNTLTPGQVRWLDALKLTAAEVYVWFPRDWPEIVKTLSEDG